MNAEQARTKAEQAQEVARARQLEIEDARHDKMAALSRTVVHKAGEVHASIDEHVEAAAQRGEFNMSYDQADRLAPQRNKPEVVAFIRDMATLITQAVVIDLKEDGFKVKTDVVEERDYRDSLDAPNEYLVTRYYVDFEA